MRPTAPATTLLFVYGTLQRGLPNHARNAGRFLGRYRTRERLPLYVVRLPDEDRAPWLVDDPGRGDRVSGELYAVDVIALQAMDAFEEVDRPDGYVRVAVALDAVDDPAAPPLWAQAYLKPPDRLTACLAIEGPFEAYTPALAAGYRLAE
jgi:gamma-glutamylaminecyclotransferase